ncbi:hypothetical protein SS37A_34220 [Methylocystis iwaonis]|uniref:Uncharacterized protein n=1 Tax=Methylocystis iwaonis TaxID=2885079 RepID=A0ABM8ED02_9HYPH|nr:hypothetical protein SS37A_34220 [Methylocystis iwaonis]
MAGLVPATHAEGRNPTMVEDTQASRDFQPMSKFACAANVHPALLHRHGVGGRDEPGHDAGEGGRRVKDEKVSPIARPLACQGAGG